MSEWNDLVKKVMKENPSLSFKECLIKAKKLYKKPSTGKKTKKHAKKSRKSKKARKSKKRSRK